MHPGNSQKRLLGRHTGTSGCLIVFRWTGHQDFKVQQLPSDVPPLGQFTWLATGVLRSDKTIAAAEISLCSLTANLSKSRESPQDLGR
ncbi:hypothetical protein RRG08_019969 [Elysia crispata]|uniref:Uncharacterized protein n=1 Tax=Elysia crispata TaxID=231223 RepID=A0AAE1D5L4_9GAST|nr:hypothetical protein RRG08_019969 [Elysia crispata]